MTHIVSGTVTGKYGRGEQTLVEPEPIQDGKKIIAADQRIDVGDYYELTVQGTDEHGNQVTKRVTVDELTFNTMAIGDKWPTPKEN